MIKKIIYPYDFSKFSEKAIPFIKDFSKLGAKKVIIVSVIEYEELFTHVLFKESEIRKLKEETIKRLENLRNDLENAGLETETVVDFGIPAKIIIKTAKESKADIIIMGSQGRGAIMNALLGSTAENVLRRSEIPVLIIPPK